MAKGGTVVCRAIAWMEFVTQTEVGDYTTLRLQYDCTKHMFRMARPIRKCRVTSWRAEND